MPCQDIVLTLQEKLSIRSIAHFALVLEEQYNLAKIHLLHEEELIAQVSRAPVCPSPAEGLCPQERGHKGHQRGEPLSPVLPSTSAMVFTPHTLGKALWEQPECPHTQSSSPGLVLPGEQWWVTSFVPPVTSAHLQRAPCAWPLCHSSLSGQSIHPGRGQG